MLSTGVFLDRIDQNRRPRDRRDLPGPGAALLCRRLRHDAVRAHRPASFARPAPSSSNASMNARAFEDLDKRASAGLNAAGFVALRVSCNAHARFSGGGEASELGQLFSSAFRAASTAQNSIVRSIIDPPSTSSIVILFSILFGGVDRCDSQGRTGGLMAGGALSGLEQSWPASGSGHHLHGPRACTVAFSMSRDKTSWWLIVFWLLPFLINCAVLANSVAMMHDGADAGNVGRSDDRGAAACLARPHHLGVRRALLPARHRRRQPLRRRSACGENFKAIPCRDRRQQERVATTISTSPTPASIKSRRRSEDRP